MSTFDACLLILLGLAFLVIIAFNSYQQKKLFTSPEKAKKIALSIINKVALALLTEAERTYGEKTGELKMSFCIKKLMELIPTYIIEVLPDDFLKEKLEELLIYAKKKWESNPKLLNIE